MKRPGLISVVCLLVLVCGYGDGRLLSAAELKPETVRAWESYVAMTEKRIAFELSSEQGFLVQDFRADFEIAARIDAGRVFVNEMQTRNVEGRKIRIPRGRVHHWFGSVRLPNIALSDVLSWVKDCTHFEGHMEDVERARLISQHGDDYRCFLRIRGKRIRTVYYNTEHAIRYREHGPGAGSSKTEALRIVQLDNPGTPQEREKPEGKDSGYLWRWNSYWRFQQKGDDVIVECETLSLSRSIPKAFSWLIRPFVRSVPKDVLRSTLASLRDAVSEAGQS